MIQKIEWKKYWHKGAVLLLLLFLLLLSTRRAAFAQTELTVTDFADSIQAELNANAQGESLPQYVENGQSLFFKLQIKDFKSRELVEYLQANPETDFTIPLDFSGYINGNYPSEINPDDFDNVAYSGNNPLFRWWIDEDNDVIRIRFDETWINNANNNTVVENVTLSFDGTLNVEDKGDDGKVVFHAAGSSFPLQMKTGYTLEKTSGVPYYNTAASSYVTDYTVTLTLDQNMKIADNANADLYTAALTLEDTVEAGGALKGEIFGDITVTSPDGETAGATLSNNGTTNTLTLNSPDQILQKGTYTFTYQMKIEPQAAADRLENYTDAQKTNIIELKENGASLTTPLKATATIAWNNVTENQFKIDKTAFTDNGSSYGGVYPDETNEKYYIDYRVVVYIREPVSTFTVTDAPQYGFTFRSDKPVTMEGADLDANYWTNVIDTAVLSDVNATVTTETRSLPLGDNGADVDCQVISITAPEGQLLAPGAYHLRIPADVTESVINANGQIEPQTFSNVAYLTSVDGEPTKESKEYKQTIPNYFEPTKSGGYEVDSTTGELLFYEGKPVIRWDVWFGWDFYNETTFTDTMTGMELLVNDAYHFDIHSFTDKDNFKETLVSIQSISDTDYLDFNDAGTAFTFHTKNLDTNIDGTPVKLYKMVYFTTPLDDNSSLGYQSSGLKNGYVITHTDPFGNSFGTGPAPAEVEPTLTSRARLYVKKAHIIERNDYLTQWKITCDNTENNIPFARLENLEIVDLVPRNQSPIGEVTIHYNDELPITVEMVCDNDEKMSLVEGTHYTIAKQHTYFDFGENGKYGFAVVLNMEEVAAALTEAGAVSFKNIDVFCYLENEKHDFGTNYRIKNDGWLYYSNQGQLLVEGTNASYDRGFATRIKEAPSYGDYYNPSLSREYTVCSVGGRNKQTFIGGYQDPQENSDGKGDGEDEILWKIYIGAREFGNTLTPITVTVTDTLSDNQMFPTYPGKELKDLFLIEAVNNKGFIILPDDVSLSGNTFRLTFTIPGGGWAGGTKDLSKNLYITYHTVLKQESIQEALDAASDDASTIVVNYSNTASAGWNGDNSTMPTSSGSHSFDASMLDKTALFLQSSGSKVSYTIEMNPYGLDLSDDDIIRLEDNMGDGKDVFAYVASSFKVVNLDTGAQLKADSTASATTYAVTMDEDGKGFSLDIPDNTPLKLTYQVKTTQPVGTQDVSLVNNASLAGRKPQGETITFDVTSAYQSGSFTVTPDEVGIRLIKISSEGADSDSPTFLPDAHFVATELNPSTFEQTGNVQNLYTNANGIIEFKQKLDSIKIYTFREFKAPDGYRLDTVPWQWCYVMLPSGEAISDNDLARLKNAVGTEVTVISAGNYVEETITNVPATTGGFRFTKQNPDGVALPGAVFGVYTDEACTEANKVGENLTSDENGSVSMTGLDAGTTYYIKEITAPRGYILNDTIYSVTIEANVDDKLVGDNGVIINVLKEAEATFAFNKMIHNYTNNSMPILTYTFTIEPMGIYDDTMLAFKDGYPVDESFTVTVTGDKAFEDITTTFDLTIRKAGTYKFKITENTNNVPDGWLFSTEEIIVTIPVTEQANGSLQTDTVAYNGQGMVMEFLNSYTGTSSFHANKKWTKYNGEEDITLKLYYRERLEDSSYGPWKEYTANYTVELDKHDAEPGEAANWDIYIHNLPNFINNKEVRYGVTEVGVDNGYTVTYKDVSDNLITEDNNGLRVAPHGGTIINELETTEISVLKNWKGDDGFEHITRPESVTVKLLANGQSYQDKQLVLNSDNNWTGSFKDLPKYSNGELIAYTVEEVPVSGYTCQYEMVGENSFEITNTLKVGEGTLNFHKCLSFSDMLTPPLEGYTFTFSMTPDANTPDTYSIVDNTPDANSVTGITPVRKNGKVIGYTLEKRLTSSEQVTELTNWAYLKFNFVTPGTYTFTLQENMPDTIEDGMYYDTTPYTIRFVVTEGNDKLEVTRVDSTNEPHIFNELKTKSIGLYKYWHDTGYEDDRPDVTNLLKYLVVRYSTDNGTTWTEYGKMSDLQTKMNITVDSTGWGENLWFINIKKLPTYMNGKVARWSFVELLSEDSPYEVIYGEVSDENQNTAADEQNIFIHNVHYAEVTFAGTKTLVGRTMTATDIFTFEITENGTNNKWTVQNDINGNIQFPTFIYGLSDVGEHLYTVKEIGTDANGITIDTKSYEVCVNVTLTDNGLSLNVDSAYTTLNFTNTYEATGKITFTGTKTVEGREMNADDIFTFEIVESGTDNSWPVVNNPQTGTIVYPTFEYTINDIGVHTYVIRETYNDGDGIVPDDTEYTVTVTVSDNGDGTLKIETSGDDYTKLNFVNKYVASGSVQFEGTKTLTGATLENGQFHFTLTGDGVNETVTNDADGKFRFASIAYTLADVGSHTYTITEANDGKAGYTYDDTSYEIVVTVADAGNGTLNVSYTVNGTENGAITFANKYSASGSVQFEGTKTLTGATLVANQFRFTLTGDGVNETVTNDADGKFRFASIAYTLDDVGEHTYTVKEVNDGKAGYTYDDTSYAIIVTVKDAGNGTLNVTYTVNGTENGAITFANKYSAAGSVQFEGTKTLTGSTLVANQFRFTLTGDGVNETVTNDADGKFRFAEIAYTLADVGTHTYTITEVNDGKAGYTYDNKVYEIVVTVANAGDGTLNVTYTVNGTENGAITFANKYSAAGSVQFEGTKTLIGSSLVANQFSFTLTGDGVNETVTNDADGKFQFSKITYTMEDVGEHTYTVKEVNDGKAGYTYDDKVYEIVVTVANAGDGTLNITYTVNGTENGAITFANKYSASGSVQFEGTKTLTGTALEDGQFRFTLSGDGVNETVTNDADGKFRFAEIAYTLDDVGEHTYTITEVNDGKAGYTYDDKVYEIIVTVKDAGNGTLNVTYTVNGTENGAITFANKYSAAGSVQFEGTKTLTGATLVTNQFRFTLTGDGVNETVTNDADGKFQFSKITYTLEDVGEHTYTVKEVNDGKAGYTYDDKVYEIVVTVKDAGNGTLNVTYTVNGTENGAITFANKYSAIGSVQFEGTKTLTGSTLVTNQFRFSLTGDGVNETVTNDAGGKFQFSKITYTLEDVGEHTYTVKEVNDGKAGYTYDNKVYTIVVTVKDAGNGTLNVTYTVNGTENGAITFANQYSADGSVQFEGTKTLTGATLVANQFRFTLSGDGVNETVTNDADGKFRFAEIAYTLADVGEHTYTVKEVNDGKAGYTYDDKEYKIVVTVANAGDGTLNVTYTVNGTENGAITFANQYSADGSVQFEGTKTLTGATLVANQFRFTLSGDGVNETVTNDADGKFRFAEIAYTLADVGEHTYTVKEVNDGKAGYTYDDTSYAIIVTVANAGDGTLNVTYTVNGTENGAITFENKYSAAGSVQFEGTKTLTGSTLVANQFRFSLTGDGVNETVTNDADGKFRFASIAYTLADVGEHTYTITEVNDGKAGYTYDNKVYTVVVTVEDAGNGTLNVTYTVNGTENGAITFANKYSAAGSVQFEGTKTLTGATLVANQFRFTLTGDGVSETVTNDADGKFQFSKITYTLEDVGEHTYTIIEVNDGKAGYTYDDTSYAIIVTVEDAGDGTLNVTYAVNGTENGAITFANKYSAIGSVQFTGTKTLMGAELQNGQFRFTLTGDGVNETVTNGADGKFRFTSIAYTLEDVGTHTYIITEVNDGQAGYIYDTTRYEIVVNVVNAGNGILYTTYTVNGTMDNAITFTNRYSSNWKSPKTGDDTPIGLCLVLSTAGCILLLKKRKITYIK